ncbi:hypothetical protein EQH57_0405 [Dictyocoela roeselum]|nr:hypothetical protein EQH57_0405 [Dictyocoela roeselum]
MVRPRKKLDDMNFLTFTTYLRRKTKVLEILQDNGFIPKQMKCSKCRKLMTIRPYKNSKSGFRWRCRKTCNNTASIHDMSYFEDCHIELKKFLQFLYFIIILIVQKLRSKN